MDKNSKRFIWNFVYESDLIEGIQNDRKKLRDEIVSGKVHGHVGAMLLLRELARNKKQITDSVIGTVQAYITAEQHEKRGGKRLPIRFIGQYRNIRVSIVSRELTISFAGEHPKFSEITKVVKRCPSPSKVPVLMKQWFRRAHLWQERAARFSREENVRSIADLHFDFEEIHPFADGNGRTGRALAYYMLQYAGIKPFIFWEYDKTKTYYPAFSDREKMREYFRIRVFEPESIVGRIETISEEDMIDF
ncbi:Fic family protein [Candidatus Jorgensenbacteria bacterium]|nr:Fic family protein [Candidatus Jorgensenbacteria bacterium]